MEKKKTGKIPNPQGRDGESVSLSPLTVDEVLRGLLEIKPVKGTEVKKKAAQKRAAKKRAPKPSS